MNNESPHVIHNINVPPGVQIDTEKIFSNLSESAGMRVPQNPPVEKVNHPSHYNQYHGFEVIDVCEQLRAPDESGNFNRGNAFKYLARAGWKDPETEIEDLEKAIFYIQREIDRRRMTT